MFDVNDYEKEIEMFNRPENKMTLDEIAADALKPENQRVYPIGTRRDWQAELEAQRLRADTAEADALQFRESSAQIASDLIVAEQRIAGLVAAGNEMLRIAAIANQGSNAYNRAIVNLHAALNPNPEAESHE